MEDKTTSVEKENISNPTTEKKAGQERTASANWAGNFKEGKGSISTQSGTLKKVNYSFKTRFENGEKGTNPEELLAAAHAGCFTMSVAAILSKKGFNPTSLDTKAGVMMEGLKITTVHLSITGSVPNISADDFSEVVKEAEKKMFDLRNIKYSCYK